MISCSLNALIAIWSLGYSISKKAGMVVGPNETAYQGASKTSFTGRRKCHTIYNFFIENQTS